MVYAKPGIKHVKCGKPNRNKFEIPTHQLTDPRGEYPGGAGKVQHQTYRYIRTTHAQTCSHMLTYINNINHFNSNLKSDT